MEHSRDIKWWIKSENIYIHVIRCKHHLIMNYVRQSPKMSDTTI